MLNLVDEQLEITGESLPALLFNGRPFGAPNPVVPIKSFVSARARAVKTQLVRIQGNPTSQNRVRDLILEAYKEHEATLAATA